MDEESLKAYTPYSINVNEHLFIHMREYAAREVVDCFYEEINLEEFTKHLITHELQDEFLEIYNKNLVYFYMAEATQKVVMAVDQEGVLEFVVFIYFEETEKI